MLPNEEKSDIENYQNTQICNERANMGEVSARSLPECLVVH